MSGPPISVAIGDQRLSGMYFLPKPAPLPAWIKPSPLSSAALLESSGRATYVVTDDLARTDAIRRTLIDVISRASSAPSARRSMPATSQPSLTSMPR